MEYFNIDTSTLIAVYGLGYNGKRRCSALIKSGYNLVGIIDRAGEDMEPYCGIPVYTPDGFSQAFPHKEEMVIIVCLTNALQHEKAVDLLSSHGYRKFLYIPMDEKMDYQYIMEMQQAYSCFENSRFAELGKIPLDGGVNRDKEENADVHIIAEDSENITFLCRIEDVFTISLSQLKVNFNRQSIYERMLNDQRHIDIPLASLEPYKNLYDYMMGRVSYPEEYFRLNGDDEDYNRKLLEDRVELFQCYEKRYNRDIRLFYLQAAAVIWNKEKNYFNVSDGGHRLMYLYYVKKHFCVPVKTCRESFEQYRKIVNKEKYMYKSPELVLQELLLPEYLSGNGAVVRQNDEDIKWLFRWARCTSYKSIEELSQSKQYDWIFYQLDAGEGNVFYRLSRYSAFIIVECVDEELEETSYGDYYKVINRGEVLTEKRSRRLYYLLERKPDVF